MGNSFEMTREPRSDHSGIPPVLQLPARDGNQPVNDFTLIFYQSGRFGHKLLIKMLRGIPWRHRSQAELGPFTLIQITTIQKNQAFRFAALRSCQAEFALRIKAQYRLSTLNIRRLPLR